MLGARHVLFLDDDVRGLSPTTVESAAEAMHRDRAVRAMGWRCGANGPGFVRGRTGADNSIVCQSRRLAGLPQGVFVGGGALLVDVQDPPLFPPVYNEDWLFMADLLVTRSLGLAGEVRQLAVDPFGDPERALDQEFGDVLGEGIFSLIQDRVPPLTGEADLGDTLVPATDGGFWRAVVDERHLMIDDVRARLERKLVCDARSSASARHQVMRALASLAVAQQGHTPELAGDLASFVDAWMRDLAGWRAWFSGLPQQPGLAHALESLGVHASQLVELPPGT